MLVFYVSNPKRSDLNSLARSPSTLTPFGRTMAIYCMSKRRKCVHNRHSDSRVGASLGRRK